MGMIEDHDAAAQLAENDAVKAATDGLSSAVAAVHRWLVGAWGRKVGKPSAKVEGAVLQDLLDELAFRITGIALDPEDSLLSHARRARLLGNDQGFVEAGLPVRPIPGDVMPETRAAVEHGVTRAREVLAETAKSVRELPEADLKAVQQRTAAVASASSILESTARTIYNTELNAGIAATAVKVGAKLLWVAERDACVTCLALSGHIIDAGDAFDQTLTFGAKAYPVRAWADGELVEVELEHPPRHPRCRCRVTLWFGHDAAGALEVTHDWAEARREAVASGDQAAVIAADRAVAAARASAATDLPTALRREAERSVLLGHALPSESENVRMQAADRLLQRIGSAKNSPSPSGWLVSASVKAKARKSLKNGTFKTGSVPTTRK
jgi:hypothetical protein